MMMTCREVESLLDSYLEGTLPWGTRLRFEFHVRMCGECKRYIARYRRAIELGQRLLGDVADEPAAEHVPQDFVDVIVRTLDESGEDPA